MTSPMTLLERVEGATGPDRELDCLVADALLPPILSGLDKRPLPRWPHSAGSGLDTKTPRYTASLDAVLALVEEKLPNLLWRVWQSNPDEYAADIGDEDTTYAATPALALLRALLTALEAGDG